MKHSELVNDDGSYNLPYIMKSAHKETVADHLPGGSYAFTFKCALDYVWSIARQQRTVVRLRIGLPVKMVQIDMGELC